MIAVRLAGRTVPDVVDDMAAGVAAVNGQPHAAAVLAREVLAALERAGLYPPPDGDQGEGDPAGAPPSGV